MQRQQSRGTEARSKKQARLTKPLSDILNSSAAQPIASKRPGSAGAPPCSTSWGCLYCLPMGHTCGLAVVDCKEDGA